MKEEGHNILVDTSAWVEFFRGTSKIADAVTKLIEIGRASICGVILYELIQGAKSKHESLNLAEILSGVPYLEMTPEIWINAGNLSTKLRGKGITVPMSDLLIGAIALEHDLEVLTLDAHFASIPAVKLYRHK